jgi:hypothetical protein
MTVNPVHDADVIERWLDARQRGHLTYSAAAAQLHMNTHDLRRIITRARDSGDPRIPSLRDTHAASYDQMSRTPLLDQPINPATDQQTADARAYIHRHAHNPDDEQNLLNHLFGELRKARR